MDGASFLVRNSCLNDSAVPGNFHNPQAPFAGKADATQIPPTRTTNCVCSWPMLLASEEGPRLLCAGKMPWKALASHSKSCYSNLGARCMPPEMPGKGLSRDTCRTPRASRQLSATSAQKRTWRTTGAGWNTAAKHGSCSLQPMAMIHDCGEKTHPRQQGHTQP